MSYYKDFWERHQEHVAPDGSVEHLTRLVKKLLRSEVVDCHSPEANRIPFCHTFGRGKKGLIEEVDQTLWMYSDECELRCLAVDSSGIEDEFEFLQIWDILAAKKAVKMEHIYF